MGSPCPLLFLEWDVCFRLSSDDPFALHSDQAPGLNNQLVASCSSCVVGKRLVSDLVDLALEVPQALPLYLPWLAQTTRGFLFFTLPHRS